jgi:hypothetical protein
MITKFVEQTRKTGEEVFTVNNNSVGVKLSDFWQWAYSDILNNVSRGKLAEFIVATALGINDGISGIWDKYDLTYKNKGIEIKSAAYLQSWYQEKLSHISFSISPSLAWDGKTGKYDTEQKRQADIYILCLLNHKDKLTVNPLNIEQWEFYILPTSLLNELLPVQKSLSLGFLDKNGVAPCGYYDIRNHVEKLLFPPAVTK